MESRMTTTMNASNPHDIFFKASMRDLRIAKDFFAAHLPTDILPYAKLDTLELISSSFIDEQMQETHSDLIYRLIIGSE
jgi:predicted transposase YdaD